MSTRSQAVKLTHLPTGIVVKHNEQRTTEANLEAAKRVMQVRLALLNIARIQPISNKPIRTYDYPSGYVVDHRINLDDMSYHTAFVLEPFMDGHIKSHRGMRARLAAVANSVDFISHNAIITISIGGNRLIDESSLFVADLFRMYVRHAEAVGYRYQHLDSQDTSCSGYRHVIFEVIGDDAYGHYYLESGVHKCLRKPLFSTSNEPFNTAAVVQVLDADKIDAIELKPDDLQVELYTSYA